MPKLSYSPLGGLDAETAQDARFLPFLLTFLRVVRDLSTDEVKLMLLHYQQVPKGFHGSPPEDAVQIDSSPLMWQLAPHINSELRPGTAPRKICLH